MMPKKVRRKQRTPPKMESMVWLPGDNQDLRQRIPDRTMRRKVMRDQAKLVKRSKIIAVTEQMIPTGSVLSEETLADIRAGNLGIRQRLPVPPSSRRTPTYAERLRARHRAKMTQVTFVAPLDQA